MFEIVKTCSSIMDICLRRSSTGADKDLGIYGSVKVLGKKMGK